MFTDKRVMPVNRFTGTRLEKEGTKPTVHGINWGTSLAVFMKRKQLYIVLIYYIFSRSTKCFLPHDNHTLCFFSTFEKCTNDHTGIIVTQAYRGRDGPIKQVVIPTPE